MTKDEALNLALEALEYRGVGSWRKKQPAITAIKEALAQPESDGKCKYCTDGCHACDARKLPEQEPVAWRYRWSVEGGNWVWNYATYIERQKDDRCEPLYTTPPQRKPPQFPTMLRKMWSGSEVQDWINENWNKG